METTINQLEFRFEGLRFRVSRVEGVGDAKP